MHRAAARLAGTALVGLLASCGDDPVDPGSVAAVVVQPDSVSLTYGQTVQLAASVRDASGKDLTGRTVAWLSLSPGVATVSATGLVTGVSWGRMQIRATVEQRSATALVVVGDAGPQDFAVTDAQFTQGVQAANGSLPLILQGNPAVLNVLVQAKQPPTTPMQLVLRLFDGGGGLVRADTVTMSGTGSNAPSYLAPSAQFLVPAGALPTAAEWQVLRDPRNAVPDDSAGNDVFPRSGRAPLLALPVPTLKVRFVPIVLSAHGGATGAVSAGSLTEYLQTVRSVQPLGVINPVIGTPFTTSASFGTPPSGGEAPFWQQVLSELDMARIADPEPDVHWYGVVRPPQGFTFTTYGGFGYIPPSGESTGPGTRTAVGVQVGWFNRPTQARDLVAHELGHNFGRRHAPCGGALGVDQGFPNPDGTIGLPGHDVYSWAQGLATSATAVSPLTGDVMGYCYPMWAGEYSYRGILEFRQGVVAATSRRVRRVLLVRGHVEQGRGITIQPAFLLDGRPSLPERSGTYRLEGRAANGQTLFAYAFEPSELDHAPNLRHFAFAIPITAAFGDLLAEVRVRGPAGDTRSSRPGVGLGPAAARATGPVLVTRGPDGLVTAVCADGTAAWWCSTEPPARSWASRRPAPRTPWSWQALPSSWYAATGSEPRIPPLPRRSRRAPGAPYNDTPPQESSIGRARRVASCIFSRSTPPHD